MAEPRDPSGPPRGWSGPPPPGTPPGPPPDSWTAPPLPTPDRRAYDLQAGVVDVRPLTFSDILDGSFTLFRAGGRVMVPIVLATMVPLQLLSAYLQREALSFGVTGVLDDPAAAALVFGGGGITPALVLTAAGQVLLVPVLGGALVLVAGRRYLGRPVVLRDVVAETGRNAGWLVLAYLATGAVRLLPLLLVALAAAAGSDVGVALATVLAVIVVVGLTPLFVLTTPAILSGTRSPVQAVVHGVRLVLGGYWRTVGVVLGTTLVFNILALLLAGLPNAIGLVGGFGFAWVVVAIGSVLSQLIVAPLTACSMVLLHADLRIRQEGMDFDVLIGRMRASAATS